MAKNIYQRINAVMQEIKYVKRESAGQGTGVKYDVVVAELRVSMIKHGIVMTQDQKGRVEKVNEWTNGTGKSYRQYEGVYAMRLTNIDDTKDFIETSISAHSMDAGDKAPGITSTYAAKVFLAKTFLLETGDNDESRSEIEDRQTGNNPASVAEVNAVNELIKEQSAETLKAMYAGYGERGITKDMIDRGEYSRKVAASLCKRLAK